MCLRQVPQRKNQTGYFDLDTSLAGCKGLPWASGKRYVLAHLGSLVSVVMTPLAWIRSGGHTLAGFFFSRRSLKSSGRTKNILCCSRLPHHLLIMVPSGSSYSYLASSNLLVILTLRHFTCCYLEPRPSFCISLVFFCLNCSVLHIYFGF